MRGFCLLTTGRAGSTSLMQALAAHDDIGVPAKQIRCPDNEIYRKLQPRRYWNAYSRLAGISVYDEVSLARAFFLANAGRAYAGFKTMPNRHRCFESIVAAHHVQVICLVRRDLASTVASFLAAVDRRTWVRSGEPQTHRIVYTPALNRRIDDHLRYVLNGLRFIRRLPASIMIEFESLCREDFCSPELDAFFGRPVRLLAPRPPVDASQYVENWADYTAYVTRRSEAL